MRVEKDLLGEREIADEHYYGIHTARALENFSISGKAVQPELIKSYALVKKTAAEVNAAINMLSQEKAAAIIQAADELMHGQLTEEIVVDALQGGAGTSTNMNVNEVIANRALEILGHAKGDYAYIDPINEVNLHQSTNDTYPTALKIASIKLIEQLSEACASLQEALQRKEEEFSAVIKMGRTQLQDAVPITLGQEFSAYAQAISRDRWRIYKCQERLKQLNIGGTAVGTGITAPRKYVFAMSEKLRETAKINIGRSENMVDATQNADVFVEVSGLLKTLAVNLNKIANDLRLMASGPHTGIGDINLPARQAGSSIMPGKVNPVIAEAVNQAAFEVMAGDMAITLAAQNGQLELNAFLPLIAEHLLGNLQLMINTVKMFEEKCIIGITANTDKLQRDIHHSPAMITALVPLIGYEQACRYAKELHDKPQDIAEFIRRKKIMNDDEIAEFLNPYKLTRPYHKNEVKINAEYTKG